MAADTKEKRLSMVAYGDGGILHVLPEPDATIDQGDRQHLLGLYSGVLAGAPVVPPPVPPPTGKPRWGQPIVVIGSNFADRQANLTTGFIPLVKTSGPRYGANRITNSQRYGSPRMQNVTA